MECRQLTGVVLLCRETMGSSTTSSHESGTKRLDTRAAESGDTMLAAHATPANGACDSGMTAGSGHATAASAS